MGSAAQAALSPGYLWWRGISPSSCESGGNQASFFLETREMCTNTSPYPQTLGATVLGLRAGYPSGKEKAPGDS